MIQTDIYIKWGMELWEPKYFAHFNIPRPPKKHPWHQALIYLKFKIMKKIPYLLMLLALTQCARKITKTTSPTFQQVRFNIEPDGDSVGSHLSCFSSWNVGFGDTALFDPPRYPLAGNASPVTGKLTSDVDAVIETSYFQFNNSNSVISLLLKPNKSSDEGSIQYKVILVTLSGTRTILDSIFYASFGAQQLFSYSRNFKADGFYKVRVEFGGNTTDTHVMFDNLTIYGNIAFDGCK